MAIIPSLKVFAARAVIAKQDANEAVQLGSNAALTELVIKKTWSLQKVLPGLLGHLLSFPRDLDAKIKYEKIQEVVKELLRRSITFMPQMYKHPRIPINFFIYTDKKNRSRFFLCREKIGHGSYKEVEHGQYLDEEYLLAALFPLKDHPAHKEIKSNELFCIRIIRSSIGRWILPGMHYIERSFATRKINDSKCPMMIQELGVNLAEFLKRNPRLPFEHKLSITVQILKILSVLRQLKIVHRDIKLENFLFFEDSKREFPLVKIIDFGSATWPNKEDKILLPTFLMPPEMAKIAVDEHLLLKGKPLRGERVNRKMKSLLDEWRRDIDSSYDDWSAGHLLTKLFNKELSSEFIRFYCKFFRQVPMRNFDIHFSSAFQMSQLVGLDRSGAYPRYIAKNDLESVILGLLRLNPKERLKAIDARVRLLNPSENYREEGGGAAGAGSV